MTTALGIDVAEGKVYWVLLNSDRRIIEFDVARPPMRLSDVVSRLRPSIIAIDSPPRVRSTDRPRAAETEMARLGLSSYSTPNAAPSDFRKWMLSGFESFEAIRGQYPEYLGAGSFEGKVIEIYPYASACFLSGGRRPKSVTKVQWRRQTLADNGVNESVLPHIDFVDAALGAATGLMALEGRVQVFGDLADGFLVAPEEPPSWIAFAEAPWAGVRRQAVQRQIESVLSECLCGCGTLVRRRFAPGHDAKLKSRLRAEMSAGSAAARQRLIELGWL